MQIALSFSFVLIFFFNHPATTVIYTLSLHDALPIWDSLQIPVLEDIKLEIGKGDFVALMGPSGSGKTTLRSEEHTSELQSLTNLVCRLLLEKKKLLNSHSTDRRPRSIDGHDSVSRPL